MWSSGPLLELLALPLPGSPPIPTQGDRSWRVAATTAGHVTVTVTGSINTNINTNYWQTTGQHALTLTVRISFFEKNKTLIVSLGIIRIGARLSIKDSKKPII